LNSRHHSCNIQTMFARTALFSFIYADATEVMRADDLSSPALEPSTYVTDQGCACRTQCGSNAREEFGRCDWCYTENGCGKSGAKGHWDYCKYAPMQEFEAQSYQEKTDQLWDRVTDRSVEGKSGPDHLAVHTLNTLLAYSMITPFDDNMEVMPAGRERLIHSQAVVCKIDLKVDSHSPFTGVLSPGSHPGMIRFGSAASLNEPLLPKIFPGFGIKFLRSGKRSANWVNLRSVGDAGSWNFFESQFSNHVAPQAALVKLHKFQQASGCITMVGLSDACTYDEHGKEAANPEFPFEIVWEPTGQVSFPDKKKRNEDMLDELASIPAGTEVFEVYTYASPLDKKNGHKTRLGMLSTTSSCHKSLFGDLNLFFRHQRVEEDFALRPDWIRQMGQHIDAASDACEATAGPVSQWQCPGTATDGVAV